MGSLVIDGGLLGIGLLVLILGGNYLVKGGADLASRFKISPMVVGLTVIAFGTSVPELLVSLQAAFRASPDLVIGNVVGSNICNLAFILGVTSLITPLPVNRGTLFQDWPVTFGAALVLFYLVQDGALSFFDGLLLFSALLIFVWFQIWQSGKTTHFPTTQDAPAPESPLGASVWRDLTLILLGGLGLYLGADWLVQGARNMATSFGVSERIIGLTVVAVGTSLPELVTSVIAARKQQADIALGNVLGSNIFNILAILGLTSMITPISVDSAFIQNDCYWMLGLTLLLLPMMGLSRKISRMSGALLLGLYLLYNYLLVL
ncbi:calcium/sodium antiporter [Persicobacter diffluens]|uniref:Sodium:calcium antiporter n=1 Tax=Persicobacter diffluens TaxID=981 RepID=A0AAN5AJP4_9BACT|nr:sodium:calcium antiporter [Persicobacter diffluens]